MEEGVECCYLVRPRVWSTGVSSHSVVVHHIVLKLRKTRRRADGGFAHIHGC